MPKKFKVFIDTSVLLSGLNSPRGASGIILSASVLQKITPIISEQVIEESERNITKKFPLLQSSFEAFFLIPPFIAKNPTLKEVRNAHTILPTTDAPILASAIKTNPDFLITLDKNHFLQKEVLKKYLF